MKYFYLVFILAFSVQLTAQGILNGSTFDNATKEQLPFTSVLLKNSATDKILGGKSDVNGIFKIKDIPFGSYSATITSVGYSPKTIARVQFSNTKQKVDLGKLYLKKKNKQLTTILIQKELKTIELKADKKVFNVEKNISAEGGTLEDVLRNVPGVSIGTDGSVSLRGKSNITILVDGKRNSLFADLETALQSVPAESIKSIEVITNPSAKYEAQGLGGIINIIMKEGKRKKGFSGSVNFGAKYNWKANAGVNLNYRPNSRIGFFLNTNGGLGDVWEENLYERTNSLNDESYKTDATKYRKPKRLHGSFGIEYNLNNRNKITWTNSVFRGSFDGNNITEIFERDSVNKLQEYWYRNNIYNAKPSNTTTNLKFYRSYKNPKQKLSVEANLSKRSYIRESDYSTAVYDGNNSLISSFIQRNPIDGGNTNGAFQIDYAHPIGKEGKIEIGEKTYVMDFYSENFPTIQYANQPEKVETILKNDFKFLQQVHGAYATYSTKYESYSFQAGLRGEYFKYDGTAAQLNNANFTTDYLSLFPSAFITKQLDERSDITFSYSRRVNRPNFFQLLPYIRVNSPLDTSIGNPGLNPEFINAFELGYNKRYSTNSTFFASVYYQLTNNIIQRYKRFNPDGSTFSQTQNLASGSTYGIELTNVYSFRKGWDLTINANGYRNVISGNAASNNQDFSGYGGFVKAINNISFLKTWQLQASGNYFLPKIIVQGKRKGFGFIDLALKKSFLNKQLSLTLIASDIFNSNKKFTEYDLSGSQFQSTMRNRQTQFFGFNLSYRFPKKSHRNGGGGNKKGVKKRDGNLKDGDGGGF